MLDFQRLLNFLFHCNPLYWCLTAFNYFEINCYGVSEKSRPVYSEKKKNKTKLFFQS